MKTEVIISIIAVVVVLAVIAYFAYNKDGFTPIPTHNIPHTTPLQIATQKGYSQIVTFLNEQHANTTAYPKWSYLAFKKTALETVYLINYATSEIEALDAIKTMYWPGVGAIAKMSVPVINYHPYGGFSNSPSDRSKLTPEEKIALSNFLSPVAPFYVLNKRFAWDYIPMYDSYDQSKQLEQQLWGQQRPSYNPMYDSYDQSKQLEQQLWGQQRPSYNPMYERPSYPMYDPDNTMYPYYQLEQQQREQRWEQQHSGAKW